MKDHTQHKGRCPTAFICHCLVVEEVMFFQCCGYYHAGEDGCASRVNDKKKYEEARLIQPPQGK